MNSQQYMKTGGAVRLFAATVLALAGGLAVAQDDDVTAALAGMRGAKAEMPTGSNPLGALFGRQADRQTERVGQRASSEVDQAADTTVDKAMDKAFDKLFGN